MVKLKVIFNTQAVQGVTVINKSTNKEQIYCERKIQLAWDVCNEYTGKEITFYIR